MIEIKDDGKADVVVTITIPIGYVPPLDEKDVGPGWTLERRRNEQILHNAVTLLNGARQAVAIPDLEADKAAKIAAAESDYALKVAMTPRMTAVVEEVK